MRRHAFCSCLLRLGEGGKTQPERRPETGAGDRLDGQEKAESSAGTGKSEGPAAGSRGSWRGGGIVDGPKKTFY